MVSSQRLNNSGVCLVSALALQEYRDIADMDAAEDEMQLGAHTWTCTYFACSKEHVRMNKT